jgi:hypothetical protein
VRLKARWFATAVAATLVAGCAGTGPSKPLIAHTCSSRSPQGPDVVQYGATRDVWNARHHFDQNPDPGQEGYDPTPGLGFQDRYHGFAWDVNDRAVVYSVRLPPGTTIDIAQEAALSELPCDGELVAYDAGCAEAELRSERLGRLFPWNPQGLVLAIFRTQGEPSQDPKNVTEVGFLEGPVKDSCLKMSRAGLATRGPSRSASG